MTDTDNFLVYLNRKAERLLHALYLVTDLMSDREPMKWALRSRGIELLEATLIPDGHSLEDRSRRAIIPLTSGIIANIGVSKRTGIISAMNHDILEREFANFIELVEEASGAGAGGMLLGAALPVEGHVIRGKEPADLNALLQERTKTYTHKGHQPIEYDRYGDRSRYLQLTNIQAARRRKDRKIKDMMGVHHGARNGEKDVRKSQILSLFRSGKRLSIKDVIQAVPAVSVKTIQRDLVRLVHEGVLRREGERRWSTYEIVNS